MLNWCDFLLPEETPDLGTDARAIDVDSGLAEEGDLRKEDGDSGLLNTHCMEGTPSPLLLVPLFNTDRKRLE